MGKKSSRMNVRPPWMNKAFLTKLKQRCVGSGSRDRPFGIEYKDIVRVGRNAIRKAWAHLQLNLARDVQDNKKGFFK